MQGTEQSAVIVNDRILVFPGSPPRCVAQSSKRSRCRLYVGPDGYQWVEVAVNDGEISVLHTEDPDAFLQQRCAEHADDSDTIDAVAPEWSEFDPEVHGSLIRQPFCRWTPQALVWRNTWSEDRYLIGPVGTDRRPEAINPIPRQLSQEPALPAAPVVTALYRYFDADDLLLYVGVTGAIRRRAKSHATNSSWSEFAARSTIDRFPSREDAEAAEVKAVAEELPLFNWQYADAATAGPRLVEYLVKHGRLDLLAPAVSRG